MATIRDRYILDLDVNGALGGLSQINGLLGNIGGGAIAAGIAGIGTAIAAIGTAAIQSAKQFETYNNQLRLITSSQADLTNIMSQLNSAAVQNRAAFGDTVDLFSKLTLATDGMGKSQQDILEVTSRFQQAIALSGADAGTASAAITQFGQAMASGTVRGDEFNSIVEALGPALIIMARESGKTVGELRAMSQAGELTADVFFEMIQNSEALGEAFGKTQKTIADLETEVADAAGKMLSSMAEGSGLADAYRLVLEGLARGMRDIAGAQTEVESATPADLFKLAREGAITYSEAIAELERDIAAFEASNMAASRGITGLFADQIDTTAYTDALEKLSAEAAIAATETERFERVQRIANETRAAALKPIQDELDAISGYSEAQRANTSELQKAIEARNAVAEVIANLQSAVGTEADKYVDLNGQLTIANAEHARLTEVINGLTGAMGASEFDQYYGRLIAGANDSAMSIDLALQSQVRLKEQLDAGLISIDTYAFAMENLNSVLGSESPRTYQTVLSEINAQLTESNGELALQQEAIAVLSEQYDTGAISVEYFGQALDALGTSLEAQAIALGDFELYINSVMDSVNESIAIDDFKAEAVDRITQQYASGVITLEQYTGALERMGAAGRSVLSDMERTQREAEKLREKSAENVQRAMESSANYMGQLSADTARMRADLEAANMTPLERQINRVSTDLNTNLSREVARLESLKIGSNDAEIDAQIKRITDATTQAVSAQEDLVRQSYEQQRSFASGWKNAFESYAEDATNAANHAQKIFQTTTSGLEDLIVNFAKTGKFEWKGFVSDMLETILRSNVQQLIAKTFAPSGLLGGLGNILGGFVGGGSNPATRGQTSAAPLFVYDISSGAGAGGANFMPGGVSTNPFSGLFSGIGNLFGGGGSSGGGLFSGLFSGIKNIVGGIGNLFGGFFATGGMIPPGRFGIVGERGPELVNGPAMVTPMQPSQVVYNISAVDALSFKQMIARDPGFIHAVAQQGSRKLPVRG